MEKVDLFLQGSRNNSEYFRYIHGRIRSDETTESAINKWRSCRHLFVKVREYKYSGAFHSSDCETIPARYECVKCGLTNRFEDSEETLHGNIDIILGMKRVTDETAEWRHQRPEISDENSLSKELFRSDHPAILFEIAIELCLAQDIKATKENVFEIMKELRGMETDWERLKISTMVQASALIERYKKKHKLYAKK